jgi:hypothetical protein
MVSKRTKDNEKGIIMYKPFIYLSALIFLISCNEGDKDFAEKKFNELPSDVQVKFNEIYNYTDLRNPNYLPPFSECKNVNTKYKCKVGYKYHNPFVTIFIPQKFVIISNNKATEIPYGTLERVFVVKNDSVYYPFTFNGGMTAMGEPRSNYIKIDTVMIRVKKMLKE